MAVNLQLTEIGIKELINVKHDGTKKIKLAQIAVGTGKYVVTGKETALKTEVKRLNTNPGNKIIPTEIRVSATDTSTDTYNVAEIGIYTDTGILLAIFSNPTTWAIEKSGISDLFIETVIVLSAGAAANVTFGDFIISNQQATETTTGIARFATSAEAQAGTAKDLLISPATLKTALVIPPAIKTKIDNLTNRVNALINAL